MAPPSGEVPAASGTAWIDERSIRRLCLAIIAGAQERMIREGRLGPDTHVRTVLARRTGGPYGLRIDEADLGLDSLARIDLVSDVSGFFDLPATGVEDYLLVERTLDDWVRRIAWHIARVGETAVIGFSTSGSTGTPRRIPRARADLDAETRAIVEGVLPERPARVLSLVSPRHLYGFLWGVLLPRALGVPCLDLQDGPPARIGREARPGDLVLATPFQWDRCASCGPLPGGILGVSSGGATSEATWEAAKVLGLEALIEVYGATETGGVGLRRSRAEAFAPFPHLARVGDGIAPRGAARPIPLPDRIEWEGEARFRLRGRTDGMVQVAGTNVDPLDVAARIAALPGVSDAAVRLAGERLKAFVVPAPGADPRVLDAAIRRALAVLPSPARPDRITFGASVPRTAMGKLSDW